MKTAIVALALIVATSSFAGGGGDILRGSVTVDTLEYQFNEEKSLSWDTYAFIGYDINKIYMYSEGEKAQGTSAQSENQLVYSRAVAPYWDLQMGVGYDTAESSNQTWAVLGVQGLAPYFFEIRATLLFAADGTAGVRTEVEYEALITQQLIVTPSVSISAYTKDIPEMGIGSGMSNMTLGARLRYEIRREFAPYIGVEWSKNFANTNVFSPLNETYAVAGLRVWF